MLACNIYNFLHLDRKGALLALIGKEKKHYMCPYLIVDNSVS